MLNKIVVCMIIVYVTALNNIQLNYIYFSTINYRADPSTPISTIPANSWVLTYNALQAGWTQVSSSANLYFKSNGTNGICVNFAITTNGVYTI